MGGLKENWERLVNIWDLKGDSDPSYIIYLMRTILLNLEDVYSVGSATELQEAIDQIGDGAGTIFVESGVHEITVPIDIDGSGSLIIYGHGDNTILKPIDLVSVFNITDAESVILEKLRFDTSNYTGATQAILVNEISNNVISFEDVSIIGNNVGIGIELQSDNCMIEHCNISLMQDGIYVNSSNRHIITQNIIQSNVRYGINLSTTLYSNISNNTCSLNLMGIYVIASEHNSISNNICNQNTEHGIYIHSSSNNTISGNTCENNDSNTANDQAGMYISNNSDFNTISGNSLNNNNNAGAGDGYGLVIATATCEENMIIANNANGNDIDYKDAGTQTIIKYYVQSGDELQDAVDSVGTGAGTIVITTGILTLIATITVNGGGDYIIEGEGAGSVIDCGANRTAFSITSARSCILRNFKIDASDVTTITRRIIDIDEVSDNMVICDNIIIVGNVAGKKGHGIQIASNNAKIVNCDISYTYNGVYTSSSASGNMLVSNNVISSQFESGITIFQSHRSIVSNNLIKNCAYGIMDKDSAYCIIEGNLIYDMYSIGIQIASYGWADPDYCIVDGNVVYGCEQGIGMRSNYGVVSNNTIYGDRATALPLLSVYGCEGAIITGNTLNNAADEGIEVWTADRCLIANNNIMNSATWGIIIIAGCNNIVIGVNLFHNNVSGNISDAGTGTIIFGDNTVYGASWNNNLGTATKNAIYDKIETLVGEMFMPPIGYIVMYSGVWVDNTTIVGWYKCDGNNGTVNLVNKFVRGGATSGATGGSDNAVVVSHDHPAKDYSNVSGAGTTSHSRGGGYAGAQKLAPTTGVSGVGKNIPAYYTLIFIQRIS